MVSVCLLIILFALVGGEEYPVGQAQSKLILKCVI